MKDIGVPSVSPVHVSMDFVIGLLIVLEIALLVFQVTMDLIVYLARLHVQQVPNAMTLSLEMEGV